MCTVAFGLHTQQRTKNMLKLSGSKPPLGYPAGVSSSVQRLGGTRNAFSRCLRPVCHGRRRACTAR